MTRRIYIYVNGILTWPGCSKNWTGRAVTWTHINSPYRAEKVEYFSGAGPSRALFQRSRARKLLSTLEYYAGWEIYLTGHSNGTDVILDALADGGWPRIERLNLVSAACESDFQKNGLNLALGDGKIGSVCVYVAEQDKALALAHTVPGKLFGYGTLGRSGPVSVWPYVAKRVSVYKEPRYGHSDWWGDVVFSQTMKDLTA